MSAMMTTEHWPIVLVNWDAPRGDDLERYFEDSRALLARRELYVMITFVKRFDNDRRHREAIAQFMKETAAEASRYCVCTAMVCTSPAFRFAFSTLLLITGFSTPYRVCASLNDALTFCRDKAGARNLVLPHLETNQPFI
jgi:hypothetical protein